MGEMEFGPAVAITVYKLNQRKRIWEVTTEPFPEQNDLPPIGPGEIRRSPDRRWLQIGEPHVLYINSPPL